MKKLLLAALVFFGIGGASVVSATTVIVDEPQVYEEQLRAGAKLVGHHGGHGHHGHRHRGHHHRGYHHRHGGGYYDGYYYYYPRHRYYDYYYYY